MASLILRALLCCACLFAGTHACAQELRFYYCYAPNPANGTVFVSRTAAVGPVEERRHYGERFAARLAAYKLAPPETQAYCVMSWSTAEIDKGKSNLRSTCLECGHASQFRDVEFAGESEAAPGKEVRTAAANVGGASAAAESRQGLPVPAPNLLTSAQADAAPSQHETVPFQVAAGLSHTVNIKLIPEVEQAFVQVHYQFFLCGQDIYVSYSLQPVPSRGVNEIRLNATVTGNFMKPVYVLQTARMVPGHRLGCTSQKYKVAPLDDFETQLKQDNSRGGVMWSRKSMIEHLLGRFSMFASGAPWPPGSH
ncbi:hypothetical protein C5614_20270 [Massilia phosphatilytica]|nr:hypothetical protein C5614_20270 [Massilia phosphatilytica]